MNSDVGILETRYESKGGDEQRHVLTLQGVHDQRYSWAEARDAPQYKGAAYEVNICPGVINDACYLS